MMNLSLKYRNNQAGVTLTELAIVLAVIAILVAIVAPTFTAGPTKRLKAAAQDLWADVRFARMEAVKRKVDIGIRFTTGNFNINGRIGSYIIFLDDGAGVGGVVGDGILNGTEGTGAGMLKRVVMPESVSLFFSDLPSFVSPFSSVGFNGRGQPNLLITGGVDLRNERSSYRVQFSQVGTAKIQSRTGVAGLWRDR